MVAISTHPRFKDLTGNTFAKWTVLEYAGVDRNHNTKWRCRCVCGVVKDVSADHLRSGRSRSCRQCCTKRTNEEYLSAQRKRFSKNVDLQPSGCMEWQGHRLPFGYGVTCYRNRTVTAHSFAYRLFRGEIPEGMCVLHHCDNPPCCNPEHLFLGTHQDNMDDMRQKGRGATGEAHGRAKLDWNAVNAIREIFATEAIDQKDIARLFDVGPMTISRIVRGLLWREPACEVAS